MSLLSNMHNVTCFRWTYVEESDVSGVAVIEIALPTGYFIHKPDMDKYVYSRVVPRLQRGRVYPKTAVFMFDYVRSLFLLIVLFHNNNENNNEKQIY